MQTIKTTYYPPTSTRGARMVAQCQAGKRSVPYDYGVDVATNHRDVCDSLRQVLGWTQDKGYSPMVGGEMPDGAWCWVFTCDSITLS